jgi:hypothetical protein
LRETIVPPLCSLLAAVGLVAPVVGLMANRRRCRRSRATTRIRSSFLVKVVNGKGVFTETLPPVGAAK